MSLAGTLDASVCGPAARETARTASPRCSAIRLNSIAATRLLEMPCSQMKTIDEGLLPASSAACAAWAMTVIPPAANMDPANALLFIARHLTKRHKQSCARLGRHGRLRGSCIPRPGATSGPCDDARYRGAQSSARHRPFDHVHVIEL